MTTAYTPILKLALPVTGELNGVWGDVVNNNITSMVEQAIAGLATINSWTANSHTLTTANGTTSESRCAMLVADDDGAGNPSAAATIICPNSSKLYIVKNISGQTVTLKTAAGTGIAVPNNQTSFLFCDGTNVEACVTSIVDGNVSGNLTVQGNATVNGNTTLGNATSDTVTLTARVASVVSPSVDNTYDLGSTANSWKDLYIDGTGYIAIVSATTGNITTVNATTVDTTNIEVTNLKAKDGTAAGSIADATGVVTLASSILTTTDINGGTIDGTTIGATSASAGAFTTLSASSTVSGAGFSTYLASPPAIGGTAAAAGSFTTLSASSTVSGTGFSNYLASPPAIGGTAPAAVSSTNLSYTGTLTGGTGVINIGSGQVYKAAGGNLGINTIDPQAKLSVSNGGAAGLEFFPNYPGGGVGTYIQSYNRSGVAYVNTAYDALSHSFRSSGSEKMLIKSTGDVEVFGGRTTLSAINEPYALGVKYNSTTGNYYVGATNSATPDLVFSRAGGEERMRITDSGNLGLGVTPSAWGSSYKAMQFPSGAIAADSTAVIEMRQNSRWTGTSNVYINNGYASNYYQYNGSHAWFTAPSGTAGNAITFTQAMTLGADGFLGLGTTSPNSNGGLGSGVFHINSGNTNGWSVTRYTNATTGGTSSDGAFFGIIASDAYVYNYEAGNIIFGTSSAEVARIDSAGRFLLGTNSNSYSGVTTRQTIRFIGGGTEYGLGFRPDVDNTTVQYFSNASGSGVGGINITTTTTTYATSSDYRLKENVQPMQGALAKVQQLKPCTYTWKSDGSDGEGFIAHELQAVCPQAVTGEKDAVDEDGKPKYQGVDTSFLVATLVAAIQELKGEFDAYKAAHP